MSKSIEEKLKDIEKADRIAVKLPSFLRWLYTLGRFSVMTTKPKK